MLPFEEITIEKEEDLRRCFLYQNTRACDYTVGTSYQWRQFYKSESAIIGDLAFSRAVYPDEGLCYFVPVGKGDVKEGLALLDQDALERGCELNFNAISEDNVMLLKEYFGNRVEAVKVKRDWFDYLYEIGQLQNFPGKKMHGQKNHWNRFKKEHPEYRYEQLTEQNLAEAQKFLEEYEKTADLNGEIEVGELKSAQELLGHVFDLQLKAGFIRTEKGITALSIGEILKDTLYIHVEKAIAKIPGAFQTIVAEFARDAAEETTIYCNREDDSGDDGLRKSKMDYHPVRFVEKFWVHIRQKEK